MQSHSPGRIKPIFVLLLLIIAPAARAGSISDDAIAVMQDVQSAYDKLKSMEISGTQTALMADGKTKGMQTFTGIYAAPNQFRFETSDQTFTPAQGKPMNLKGASVFGCTGSLLYTYVIGSNQYRSSDVPAGQKVPEPGSHAVMGMLEPTCPPLIFAVIEDGTKTWRELAKFREEDIAKGKDTVLDGKKYLTIICSVPGIFQTQTLLIDPQTHLVRRLIDEMDQPNNKIIRTYDFAVTKTDVPIGEEKFKWSPPAGWKKQ